MAKETGNTDEEIKIAEEIADAKFELKDLERQKHLFDRKQKATAEIEQVQQPAPTQPQQQRNHNLTQEYFNGHK